MGFFNNLRGRLDRWTREGEQLAAAREAAERRQVQRRRDLQYLREKYYGGNGQEHQRRARLARAVTARRRRDERGRSR